MTGTIGIITNDKRQVFQHDIIEGVSAVVADSYTVLISSLDEEGNQPLDIDTLDGILVIANVLSHDELQTLYETGKPITLVSHQEPDLPIPAVVQNNRDGMLKLVNYIVEECGRREIVFIRGDMNQHDGQQRDMIFQMGLMQHDLTNPNNYNLVGDFDAVTATNSMMEFLDSGKSFDAVIASDYLMGCGVLDLMRFYEIDIPNDVSIVAFGDGAEALDMGLTVAGVDVIELGKRSARQLLSQIEGAKISGITWLNTDLIVRDSS
ncbi:MAG: LacI family DNA-binding transcriptional regulator [Phototrophicaceae bacterium]